MIHSGSRNLGSTIADYYHQGAVEYCWQNGEELPDKDLAFLNIDDDAGVGMEYIRDMDFALHYAQENRYRLMESVMDCIHKEVNIETSRFGTDTDMLRDYIENCSINIHHNYASLENHFGKDLWIHRKGATSAKVGEIVIIPGSMGTVSYIGTGKGNFDSFMSCSHGAGRKHGRNDATRKLDPEQCNKDMEGIVFGSWKKMKKGSLKGKYNLGEAPAAYKDIDEVMAAQKDLVEINIKLRPIMSVKGD